MPTNFLFAALVVLGMAVFLWMRGGHNMSMSSNQGTMPTPNTGAGHTAGGAGPSERGAASGDASTSDANAPVGEVTHTDAEWRGMLTSQQYEILRNKGTERAFTGAYWNNHEDGRYLCAGCGLVLFDASTKFESGTGWPSFWQPVAPNHVKELADHSYGMTRVEAECARCGGHLGHIFEDGPRPTGLRYCMNSASLKFEKK